MPDLEDLSALRLSLELAASVTAILLVIGTPLSWWLATGKSGMRRLVSVMVTLPLVLPPTVLGFYLLLLLGPEGPIGKLTQTLGIGLLPFTFPGLVFASCLYSLPFVVQPIQNAFLATGKGPMEAAATLGASRIDAFFTVALPLARSGLITASVLGFAHTLGEFGVVLMIGGNIPDKTQVLSVAIYNHVEALEYTQAHWLSGGMLAFSFLVLAALYSAEKK